MARQKKHRRDNNDKLQAKIYVFVRESVEEDDSTTIWSITVGTEVKLVVDFEGTCVMN